LNGKSRACSDFEAGGEGWNAWREENPNVRVDLRRARLNDMDIQEANLQSADLREADLFCAKLVSANLSGANIVGAELRKADLRIADLFDANLSGAILWQARLILSSIWETNLFEADLSEARVGGTNFAKVDLSGVKGLEDVRHEGSSTIGIDTLQVSRGRIPEVFLRGCGLSDLDIEYAKLASPGLDPEEVTNINYRIHEIYCGGGEW